jgi:hypothetical protein
MTVHRAHSLSHTCNLFAHEIADGDHNAWNDEGEQTIADEASWPNPLWYSHSV